MNKTTINLELSTNTYTTCDSCGCGQGTGDYRNALRFSGEDISVFDDLKKDIGKILKKKKYRSLVEAQKYYT